MLTTRETGCKPETETGNSVYHGNNGLLAHYQPAAMYWAQIDENEKLFINLPTITH